MIGYKTIIIAVLIGVVPALIISWWFLRGNIYRRGLGVKLLFTVFFWGVLTAIPASILQIVNIENGGGNYFIELFQKLNIFNNNYFISRIVVPLIIVAIIEETTKGLGVLLSLKSFSKSERASKLKINPGLVAGIMIGLAFGVTENGVYFANNFNIQSSNNLATLIILRFILSTSAHMIYTGLFGAFLVDAMIAKQVFGKVFKIILAFIIPIFIHTVFNILVSTEYGLFAVPLIITGVVLLAFKAFWPLTKIE